MREGKIHSPGAERVITQLRLILPLIGIFSIVIYGITGSIVSHVSPAIWSEYTSSGMPAYGLLVMVAITVVSFVYLGIAGRGMAGYVGDYEVNWVDTRDEGGALRFSYVNTKGRKRVSLTVSKVKALPEKPLAEIVRVGRSRSREEPISALPSSMTVIFRGKIFALKLGFHSPEELKETYLQLRL